MFSFIWDDLVWTLPIFFIALCYITGDLIQMLFKRKKGVAIKVLTGFVIVLCLFHLTSLPFMYNDWPFTTLYTLFLCELISLILAYCILSIIKRRIPFQDDVEGLRKAFRDIASVRWWHFILWAVVLALIVWHVAMVIQHVAFNVDDNFYVAESVTFLSRDRLMTVLPACGIEGSVFPATYVLVSWETFLAALSRLFAVSPAVLCHSLIPALLIPLHYIAYYVAGREFSRRKSAIFLLFVILMNFVCGPSTYDQGAFLTLRIWQGKAVLVNIILPLLLYVFYRITKTARVTIPNIFFLFTLLLASQAATTVGTYLAPVLYAVYAITFLIIRRKWKPFLMLLIPAAGIVPFVLWKLMILINAGSLESISEGTGVYSRSFLEIMLRYFGFSIIPVFFILAIVILCLRLKKGPQKHLRFFSLISSGILIICFINPLVKPFAEHYVTGTGVYWRMFWLLQITLVVAAGFAQLCDIPKLKLARISVMLFLSIALLVSGRNIFLDEDVQDEFDNHAKLSKTTVDFAEAVKNDILYDNPGISEEELNRKLQETILLLPRNHSLELRQYADISQIDYAYVQNNYYAYQTKNDYKLTTEVYNDIYSRNSWDGEELYNAVSHLGIDYIAIDTASANRNSEEMPFWFEPVYVGDFYTLYKTNGGH